MALHTIRLALARGPGVPNGRDDTGYEFRAPLDADGHLDAAAWPASKKDCTVKHFEDGIEVETGHLVHRGRGWFFHYEGPAAEDDEPIFKFDRHRFVAGEYVSITEHDGVQRTFKVVQVS